ncbi:shugoshin 1 [Aplochiton taeniatus]
MGRERGQKKSFEQSLEDIKERMKEKRSKRLNSAVAPRGRSKNVSKTSAGNVRRVILKGVQLNNKVLAVALQAEKEKVRQYNGVILQLKREQQALFLHLLLLKRRLKEHEALAKAAQSGSKNIPTETPKEVSCRVMQSSPRMDEPLMYAAPSTCSDQQPLEDTDHGKFEGQINLPRTVGVRRRRAESGRRSECGRKRRSFSIRDYSAPPESHIGGDLEESKAFVGSPIPGDDVDQGQTQLDVVREPTSPIGSEEFQHSTPEPAPAEPTNQQQQPPRRRGQAQQPPLKPEPPARKPERGRKPDRAPLKKPWENSKPRARSKSRDRSASKAKTAPVSQGEKLNTSLGFNDTFDFDCEGAVHLTPFRAKAEDGLQAAPIQQEASGKPQTSSGSLQETESSSSSESEGSPYVPQKVRKRLSPPERVMAAPARRCRPPMTKIIPTQTEHSHRGSRKEDGPRPIAAAASAIPGKEELHSTQSADCVFADSLSPITNQAQENQSEPHRVEVFKDGLPPVTPGVEAEMMRIDNVLCGFGDTQNQTPGLPCHTPSIAKTCRRGGLSVIAKGRGFSLCDVTNMSPAAYRKFPSTGSRPSDARCSTPVPARKRRSTMAVDYKEPSLNAKLRRGDKFTDTKFLRSPIFKQKPRKSMQNQSSLGKYDDSFVGCRY